MTAPEPAPVTAPAAHDWDHWERQLARLAREATALAAEATLLPGDRTCRFQVAALRAALTLGDARDLAAAELLRARAGLVTAAAPAGTPEGAAARPDARQAEMVRATARKLGFAFNGVPSRDFLVVSAAAFGAALGSAACLLADPEAYLHLVLGRARGLVGLYRRASGDGT